MGVSGLTTFIDNGSSKYFEKFQLHDCNLVIDGNSLACQLYRLSPNSNAAFGGSYDSYATCVRQFFDRLKKCNITPYVLFDGGIEQKKLRTVTARFKDKLSAASRLTYLTQNQLTVFPLLITDVLVKVLLEADVRCTTCEFEADEEIATVARVLNCPVLSYDSDFFIYNVLYIPFPTLAKKPSSYIIDGQHKYFIHCQIYKAENFLRCFKGLEVTHLPLLAVLLGNDYIKKSTFRAFFNHLKLSKSRQQNQRQRLIRAILEWLAHESFDSAVKKVTNSVKQVYKQKVLNLINENCAVYYQVSCASLQYLDIDIVVNDNEKPVGVTASLDDSVHSNDDISETESEDNSDLPNIESNTLDAKVSQLIRKNKFPSRYINLYCNGVYYASPQNEDSSQDDANICAFPMIRYSYDIMTAFYSSTIAIFGREKYCMHKFYIEPEERQSDDKECKLHDQRSFYSFFEDRMECKDLKLIWDLPRQMQAFMLAILWWFGKATNITLTHVYSLIICYISLSVVDDNFGIYRGHLNFNKQFASKLNFLRKSTKNKQVHEVINISDIHTKRLNRDDCMLVNSKLLEFFEISNNLVKNPKSFDCTVVHSFSEFQSCLLHLNSLNAVCGYPVEPTVYSKVFNGVFVYNVYNNLLKHKDQYNYIVNQYLLESPSVLSVFDCMFNFVHKYIPKCEEPPKLGKNAVSKNIYKHLEELTI